MYGWFYPTDSNVGSLTFGQAIVPDGTFDAQGNVKAYSVNFVDTPFNGTGRLHTTTSTSTQQWPTMSNFTDNPLTPTKANPVDDYYVVNYTFFDRGNPNVGDFLFKDPTTGKLSTKPFLRDPERYSSTGTPRNAPNGPLLGTFAGGFNPSYTYPDNNALYLAAVTSSGTVLQPSYHRTDTASGGGPLSGGNWNTPVSGKYMTLRPTQDWHPNFPNPPEAGGDVKNLYWTAGGNDSIWVDGDVPVLISQDGRKYKMVVAPLILDLDNRANLNVIGNILAAGNGQASNQGWGGWEANPRKLVPTTLTNQQQTALHNEWAQLFLGNPVINPPTLINATPTASSPSRVIGRYGPGGIPTGRLILPGIASKPQALVDYDGIWNSGVHKGLVTGGPNNNSQAFFLPGANANAPGWTSFPFYDPNAYANGIPIETQTGGTLGNPAMHPLVYNVVTPALGNRAPPIASTVALLRTGGTNGEQALTDLDRLLPLNMSVPRIRQMATTYSFDLDRPGYAPYMNDTSAAYYQYYLPNTTTTKVIYPIFAVKPTGKPAGTATTIAADMSTIGAVKPTSDYNATTWQGGLVQGTTETQTGRFLDAITRRIDLNRITDTKYSYPQPDATSLQINSTDIPTMQQFAIAQKSRCDLARDIFNALRLLTGAKDPIDVTPNPTSAEFMALPLVGSTLGEYRRLHRR